MEMRYKEIRELFNSMAHLSTNDLSGLMCVSMGMLAVRAKDLEVAKEIMEMSLIMRLVTKLEMEFKGPEEVLDRAEKILRDYDEQFKTKG